MKLIILSLLAFLTSVARAQSPCCPCNEPGVINYVIEVPDSPQGNPSNAVPQLLNVLIKSGVIDAPTATSILVTFRIPVPSNFPQGGNPITKDTVNSLPIQGNPNVRKPFVDQLTPLLDQPSIPRLIKILSELILNNNAAPLPEVLKITITYGGVVPDVKVQVPETKVTELLNTTPAPQPTPYQQGTTPNVQTGNGKPTDSKVEIPTDKAVSPSDAGPLITFLVTLLTRSNIIDKPTGDRIIVTFVPDSPIVAKPLSPNGEQIPVQGLPRPAKKFNDVFILAIRNQASPDAKTYVIVYLLQLLIDNGVIDLPTAVTITTRYNVPIRVSTVDLPAPLPTGDDIINRLVPSQPSDNTFTITQVLFPDNLPTLINRLLQILVNKRLVDQPTANRILVTFRIPAEPDSPFQPDSAQPLNPTDTYNLPINGEPYPKDKLTRVIINLIQNPSQEPTRPLVKSLVEFVVDNGVTDAPSILQLLVRFGIGSEVRTQPLPKPTPAATTPNVQTGNGKPTDSTVTITAPVQPTDAAPLINFLVTLLTRNNIVDKPTGDRIIVTFVPNSNVPAQPLSPGEPITVSGLPKPSKKFTDFITRVVPNTPNAPSDVIKYLLQLLIDNGVIDLPTATTITVRYNIPIRVTTVELPAPLPTVDEVTNSLTPGQPSDNTFTITQVLYPDNVPTLINRLFQILVTRRLIDVPTVNRILVTFRVPAEPDSPFNPSSAQPLNPNDVTTLPISGEPIPKDKFIRVITSLIQNPSPQGPNQPLVKSVIEFVVDNGVADPRSILQVIVRFGLGAQVQTQQLPQTTQQPGGGTTPNVQTGTGKPTDSTVTITTPVQPNGAEPLIRFLVSLLTRSRIVDQPTGDRIILTLVPGSTSSAPGSQPFSPGETVPVNGLPKPSKKFTDFITTVTRNPNSPNVPSDSIKYLLQLLIDNGVIDLPTATQITVRFNIGIRITTVELPAPLPTADEVTNSLTPGQPTDNTFTITQVLNPDNVPTLINRLFQILVTRRLIDVPTVNRILVTFRVPAEPDSPFNPSSAQPLGPNDGPTLVINGEPYPKDKFIRVITSLIQNPSPQGQGPNQPLVKSVIEFVVDNGVADPRSMLQIIVRFGLGAQVQTGQLPQPVTAKPQVNYQGPINPGQLGVSTVTISQIFDEDVPNAVNGLLEIAVSQNIFDVPTANSLLVTFRVPGGGRFNPSGAQPLSPSTVYTIRINTEDAPKQRFITSLVSSFSNPVPSRLVQYILTLLLDNGTVDLSTAQSISRTFRIAGSFGFRPTPKPVEPQITPGNRPPAGQYLDSTVTITQVMGDNIKPLIVRLVQLNVQAGLFPQSFGASLLATFGIQLGGSTSLSSLFGSLTFTGKDKFIRTLTSLLGNPSSTGNYSYLVKCLTESLLDNAVFDMRTATQFCVAYGVATSVRVATQFSQTSGGGGGLIPDIWGGLTGGVNAGVQLPGVNAGLNFGLGKKK